jgi:hypothetical protein
VRSSAVIRPSLSLSRMLKDSRSCASCVAGRAVKFVEARRGVGRVWEEVVVGAVKGV